MKRRAYRTVILALVLTLILAVNVNYGFAAEQPVSSGTQDPTASALTGTSGEVKEADNEAKEGGEAKEITEAKEPEEKQEKNEPDGENENENDGEAMDKLAEAIQEVSEDLGDSAVVNLPTDGTVTKDVAFTVSGQAQPGAVVTIRIETGAGEKTYEGTVGAEGKYVFKDLPLGAGLNDIKVAIKGANGEELGESEKRVIAPGAKIKRPKDVARHWAEAEIEKLVAMKIVGGYDDGTFKPDNKVTGSEFAKVLTLAGGLKAVDSNLPGFQDLPADFWAKKYINAALKKGVIKGEGDIAFDAEKALTRAQIAVLLVRALGLEDKARTMAQQELKFTDSQSVPDWSRGAVAQAVQLGLIKGYEDGTFRPDAPVDRAVAAALISRFIKAKESK